jgi:hypothetical protein
MGSWVSGTFGYGIVVPSGDEDEEYEPTEWVKQYGDVEKYNDDEYWTIEWYGALNDLCKELGLTHDFGYVHDYGGGSAIFAGKTLSSYDTVKSFKAVHTPTPGEVEKLKEAADRLGIEFDPGWILVISYG